MAKEKNVAPATTPTTTVATPAPETPIVETPKPAPEIAEPTSEALTALNVKLSAAKKAAISAPEDTKEQDEAFMEVYKVKEEIKVEIANIRKTEAEAAQKERNAGIVKLYDDSEAAAIEVFKSIGNDALTLDEKNAISDNAKKLREIVVNKLLGQAPKGATAGTANSGGGSGETTKKILALITENRAKGMNDADNKKAVADAGFAVGTIWGILDKFKKENGAVA